MEIISLISNVIQQKEKDMQELCREKIRVECKLEVVEKEKNMCKQQLDQIQHSNSNSFVYSNQNSFLPKSPAAGGGSFIQRTETTPNNGGSKYPFRKEVGKINSSNGSGSNLYAGQQSRLLLNENTNTFTASTSNMSTLDKNNNDGSGGMLRNKLTPQPTIINLR